MDLPFPGVIAVRSRSVRGVTVGSPGHEPCGETNAARDLPLSRHRLFRSGEIPAARPKRVVAKLSARRSYPRATDGHPSNSPRITHYLIIRQDGTTPPPVATSPRREGDRIRPVLRKSRERIPSAGRAAHRRGHARRLSGRDRLELKPKLSANGERHTKAWDLRSILKPNGAVLKTLVMSVKKRRGGCSN